MLAYFAMMTSAPVVNVTNNKYIILSQRIYAILSQRIYAVQQFI